MRLAHRALACLLAATTLAAPYAVADAYFCVEPVRACPQPAPPEPDPAAKPHTNFGIYKGLGTWVDAYDFSPDYGYARTTPASVDDMAKQGVKTLYIQGAKDKDGGGTGVLNADLLGQFVDRAHAKQIKVVGWYLPRFVSPSRDWAHVDAMLKFKTKTGQRLDAVGLDIESRENGDVKVRNDRLVALSTKLRNAAGTMPTSAIVVPPVVTDKINTSYWPDFPWAKIKPSYDVWIPMSYYTMRGKQPEWRDAYTFSAENVKLIRKHVGPTAQVHLAGGLGTDSKANDYAGLVRAAKDTDCLGASSYDYAVTAPSAWATLRKSPA
jgi:hypothetical protein